MLQATDLCKSYDQHGAPLQVLEHVSFQLEPGEFVVLRGRSGSGKSTLLNILGLLSRPDSGCLRVAGKQAVGLSEGDAARLRATALGFVFQAFNLLPHLSAQENITLAAIEPERIAARRARALLERFQIAERADHLPGQLSGGEQQRVALARALINRPKAILADEPTGNLDEDSERLVLEQLRATAEAGCAVLVVSHARSVARAADRRLHLVDGRIAGAADTEGSAV